MAKKKMVPLIKRNTIFLKIFVRKTTYCQPPPKALYNSTMELS